MNFKNFKAAVSKQFAMMQNGDLYRAQVDKDVLWETYLGSFPAGSNEIYKIRTEHDCSCCKQFIRAIGDAVAIIDGKLVSIWDVDAGDPNYQVVADALSALVKSKPIADVYLHFEKTAGTDKNFQQILEGVKTWEHFFVSLPNKYVKKNAEIASTLGDVRALHDVFARSLAEIDVDSIDTVLELIAQNTLYRGEEQKFAVKEFKKYKVAYNNLPAADRDNFVWSQLSKVHTSVLKMRNTVIGSLLTELAEGKELESAVAAFESKVAPANYKRPTALVTKAMIEKAKEAVETLGLTSALQRRYATINDITVNNILFANRDAKKQINGGVFDELAAKAPIKSLDKVDEVSIEKFLTDILPKATGIELLVENRHVGNFVSLIAPVDATAASMFKWNNKFSWTYNGDFADSIKERVKQAGGSIVGDVLCRLAWEYSDDLDFHMVEENSGANNRYRAGYEIYFGNKRRTSPNGGMLDVDANGGDGIRPHPVENIFYKDKRSMRDGVYVLSVHNYNKRTSEAGFVVEIEIEGTVHQFGYEKAVRQGETIEIARINYSRKDGFAVTSNLKSSTAQRETWGVTTQTFQKVNVMMMSPNYWDGTGVGNKHYFFMLDGCKNEGSARGFYNEFLMPELDKHRKVIEMVGAKMKTESADQQLSGLGFSSTQRNSVLCKVAGNFSRTIKITF